MVDIVLVHTGNIFPVHLNDCIYQLKKFNFNIHLIVNQSLINKVEYDDIIVAKAEDYYDDQFLMFKLSNHDTNFRDGFWLRTSSRFFLISNYSEANNLKSFFHIENDNLIFSELSETQSILDSKEFEMAIVIDSETRCIPSIVWFRNSSICQKLSNHIFKNNSVNDMENLFNFYSLNKNIVTNLPIVPSFIDKTELISSTGIRYSGKIDYSNFFTDMNCIFDGAALGQYISGIDTRDNPRDTRGFINETMVYDVSKFKFEWLDGKPFIINGDQRIKIVNLHIHSKDMKKIIIDF